MWRIMMGAEKPFTVKDGQLEFSLNPKLHKDFFDGGKVSFLLFGRTEITYINRSGKSTWDGVKVSEYRLKRGETVTVPAVTGRLAEEVRAGGFNEIEVELI